MLSSAVKRERGFISICAFLRCRGTEDRIGSGEYGNGGNTLNQLSSINLS